LRINPFFSITGVFATISLVVSAGPILGEMIATMPPINLFFPRDFEGLAYQEVAFPTNDGLTLRGWFFPANQPNAPAVLYAPATGKDQRQGISLVEPLHNAGYAVLLFSYRGSGKSDGNRLGFSYGARESLDIDAAVRYLSETRGIQRIGAIGHSAGAVSIILSAARNPKIDAVVAAASYTTLKEVWRDNRPLIIPEKYYEQLELLYQVRKQFSHHLVRPVDEIASIAPRPILLINGEDDKRISKRRALELYEAASEPKQIIWLPDASHARVRSPGLDVLMPEIVNFLDGALRGPAL
jgi:dipeptidyl aminopeptidase/acylaminoacyl peptidase